MSVRLAMGALLCTSSLLGCSHEPTPLKAPSDIQPGAAASSAPVLEPGSGDDAAQSPPEDRRTTRTDSDGESESDIDLRRRIRQGAMADSLL